MNATTQTCPATADSELLDLLLDATTDGVMDWDLVRGHVRYTARWKMLLGYESENLVESPSLWTDLTHPDDLPRVRELLAEHLEDLWPFSHTWRMRDFKGEWRWLFCRAVSARDTRMRATRLVAVFTDVTERIRADERHRALVSAIPDLLLRVRVDGTVLDFKPPAHPTSGCVTRPETGSLLAHWHPAQEWCDRVTKAIREGMAGAGISEFEVAFDVAGTRRNVEMRVVPGGQDEGVCIMRDVTEQRRLQVQVMQASKLESIGQLAAGIAHEINTPMQYVGDSLNFVQDACRGLLALIGSYDEAIKLAETPAFAKAVEGIGEKRQVEDLDFVTEELPRAVASALQGVERVTNIVRAMKDFAHPAGLEKTPCDLNHEIETTITISSSAWKMVADIERDLDPNLPSVVCHPGEVNQVVLNLIVNAAHAIGDVVQSGSDGKGVIRISTTAANGQAEIRVSDTGGGIPVSVRERIFDPFFTTKEVGRGTGQGLAIARNTIVDKHGGSIDFETEVGKGTTFIVRLPLEGRQGIKTSDGIYAQ